MTSSPTSFTVARKGDRATAASTKRSCGWKFQELHFSPEMPTVTATHIWLDDRGVAWIDQTNVKVIEVVLDKLAHGSSPEEMHFQYPHLSLAQIHAALAYYYDHQSELDAEIQR